MEYAQAVTSLAAVASTEAQDYVLVSPLGDALLTLFGAVILAFLLQLLRDALRRRREGSGAQEAVVQQSERDAASELDLAIHRAHERFRRGAGEDIGEAVARMGDELGEALRRRAFTLTDPEVRDRVLPLGQLLSLSVAVEYSDGELDEAAVGFAVERAVINARCALSAYARGEPLPPPSFPAGEEFPGLIWMVPSGARWDGLYRRLGELRPSGLAA